MEAISPDDGLASGGFRYASLTSPVVLTGGMDYVLAAFTPQIEAFNTGGLVTDPRITIVEGLFLSGSEDLPTNSFAPLGSPSLQFTEGATVVPLPAGLPLLLTGVAGLALAARRRA